VDRAGTVYAAGETSSAIPTVNAFQPSFAGDIDAVAVKLSSAANLRVTIADGPDPVAMGGTLGYTIAVVNIGPDAATNVRLFDSLPSGVTLLNVAASQGTCTGTTSIVCSLGVLDTGGATVQLRVRPISSSGALVNTASVTRFEPDPVSTNNSATVTTATTGGFRLATVVNTLTGGVVISSPAGIKCQSDCVQMFAPGLTVRLVASPSAGWRFINWTGVCTGMEPVCDVTMTDDRLATAVFLPIQ
jgi:uncharacterized repeat protein (TIGR01451 family)